MSMTMRATVEGIPDLSRKLDSLGTKIRRKVLRTTCQKAGTAMVKEAKARVPKRLKGFHDYAGGQLKKSLGQKVKSYSGAAVTIAGPRDGFRIQVGTRTKGKRKGEPIYVDPRKYAHLVNNGTRHSAPIPFVGQATLNVGGKQAAATLASEVEKAIAETSRE